MKRIGYPVLITAAYIALLTIVFSSEFGQKNTFLFDTSETALANVNPSSPEAVEVDEPPVDSVPVVATTEAVPLEPDEDGHSPEGAQE